MRGGGWEAVRVDARRVATIVEQVAGSSNAPVLVIGFDAFELVAGHYHGTRPLHPRTLIGSVRCLNKEEGRTGHKGLNRTLTKGV